MTTKIARLHRIRNHLFSIRQELFFFEKDGHSSMITVLSNAVNHVEFVLYTVINNVSFDLTDRGTQK